MGDACVAAEEVANEAVVSLTRVNNLSFSDTLDAVRSAQERLLEDARQLSESGMREESLLPGWTRGHVLTHLARNADAQNRLILGLKQGRTTPLYPGGQEARAAAIEEGAGRPVNLMLADLEFSGNRVLAAMAALTDTELVETVAWRRPVTASFLPHLRWRELEIHHLDLNLGYTINDWPTEFVDACLATELPLLADRAPNIERPKVPDSELLAWLIGRPSDPTLPQLSAWL